MSLDPPPAARAAAEPLTMSSGPEPVPEDHVVDAAGGCGCGGCTCGADGSASASTATPATS